MSRRVVVSGIGAVTGLGVGIGALWEGLVAGRSCLAPATCLDPSGFKSRLVGEAKDVSAKDHVPKHYRKAVKVMARDIELAVVAANFAVQDAGLTTRAALGETEDGAGEGMTYRPDRMGCQIGAGLISAETDEMSAAMATATLATEGGAGAGGTRADAAKRISLKAWGATGIGNLTPLWLLKYLPNMLACHVTILHGAEGPSNTITCWEASGLLSIGESRRVIERGDADLCFTGGAESKLNPMGFVRMELAGHTAETGDETDGARIVRPYNPEGRVAGLLSEGAGIVILEALDTARARGAKVYAEAAGFGAAHSDLGYSEGENDEGYRYAVENALDDAGIGPEQIDAIVPLASGVPTLDRAEAGAFRAVFGKRLPDIPIVPVAANVGNAMAGASAVLAAVGAKMVQEQRLPARVYHGAVPSGLRVGPEGSRPAPLRHVLVCTGSLGGQNAALVLKRME